MNELSTKQILTDEQLTIVNKQENWPRIIKAIEIAATTLDFTGQALSEELGYARGTFAVVKRENRSPEKFVEKFAQRFGNEALNFVLNYGTPEDLFTIFHSSKSATEVQERDNHIIGLIETVCALNGPEFKRFRAYERFVRGAYGIKEHEPLPNEAVKQLQQIANNLTPEP